MDNTDDHILAYNAPNSSPPPPLDRAIKDFGESLVDHEPRGGYLVAHLTVDELVELYVVRAALETAALSAAVRRAGVADDVEVTDAYATLSTAISAISQRLFRITRQ